MLMQAIQQLVFQRDTTKLSHIFQLCDQARQLKVIALLCSRLPLYVAPDGGLRWIKEKKKLKSLNLPDCRTLNSCQKENLANQLLSALSPLGLPPKGADSLVVRLRRLRAEAVLTADFGHDHKLAAKFLDFCRENSALIGRKETSASHISGHKDPDYWLDASEQSNSVRAISAGIPDSNRRRH